jgi:hypothetical protein
MSLLLIAITSGFRVLPIGLLKVVEGHRKTRVHCKPMDLGVSSPALDRL